VLHRCAVGRIADHQLIALAVSNLLTLGIVDTQVGVNLLKGGVDVLHTHQHLLAALVEDVFLLAEQVFDVMGIQCKLRYLYTQPVEAFAGQLHQLGHQEGSLLGSCAVLSADGFIQLFVTCIAHLRIIVTACIGKQLCNILAAFGTEVKRFKQSMSVLTDLSLHCSQLCCQFLCLGKVLIPCLLIGIDVLEVPCKAVFFHVGCLLDRTKISLSHH